MKTVINPKKVKVTDGMKLMAAREQLAFWRAWTGIFFLSAVLFLGGYIDAREKLIADQLDLEMAQTQRRVYEWLTRDDCYWRDRQKAEHRNVVELRDYAWKLEKKLEKSRAR